MNPSPKTPHAVDDAVVQNAEVNTFTRVGNTMYAGGRFHTIQNPNRSVDYIRSNLFSFNIDTGKPTSWKPSVDGEVNRTLRIGGFLYVGGTVLHRPTGSPTIWCATTGPRARSTSPSHRA